jgi:hypothetical protein
MPADALSWNRLVLVPRAGGVAFEYLTRMEGIRCSALFIIQLLVVVFL